MIKVTVELCPFGDETKARHLGTAYISNDGAGTRDTGDYNVKLSKWGAPKQTWKAGRVEGFERLRLGPWDLIYLALRATVGGRNKQHDTDTGAQGGV